MIFVDNGGEVFFVSTEHFGQALVSEVDVRWMHLVKNKLVAVVLLHLQLGLQLIEVDWQVLTLLIHRFLLLKLTCSTLLRILDAAIARLALWSTMLGSTMTVALCLTFRRTGATLAAN